MEKVVKDAGAGKKKVSTRQLVSMAMLGAISIVLVSVVHFPLIPAAAFLEYAPADIPILIGTFAYGPLAGLLMTIVVSIIQGVTVSAQSGPIGVVMHIFATGFCALVAGGIYSRNKSKKTAILALICGALGADGGYGTDEYDFYAPVHGRTAGNGTGNDGTRHHSFQPAESGDQLYSYIPTV